MAFDPYAGRAYQLMGSPAQASYSTRPVFNRFRGFGDDDLINLYFDDNPDAAWQAAQSQWAPGGQSRNQRRWLGSQQGEAYGQFDIERNRRLLKGDTEPYEWTDYLTAFDPNAAYAAATPGEKGLYRGRFAPYGGFQGLR